MMWLLQDVNVHPRKILHAAYSPHCLAGSGNHGQLSHLSSIHEAKRADGRSRGAFIALYELACRGQRWSFSDFLPGETGSSHGLDINALMGPFRIAFAKFLRQNCTNRGFRLQVGNNGNTSGQKVREVVQRVPPLAKENRNIITSQRTGADGFKKWVVD